MAGVLPRLECLVLRGAWEMADAAAEVAHTLVGADVNGVGGRLAAVSDRQKVEAGRIGFECGAELSRAVEGGCGTGRLRKRPGRSARDAAVERVQHGKDQPAFAGNIEAIDDGPGAGIIVQSLPQQFYTNRTRNGACAGTQGDKCNSEANRNKTLHCTPLPVGEYVTVPWNGCPERQKPGSHEHLETHWSESAKRGAKNGMTG